MWKLDILPMYVLARLSLCVFLLFFIVFCAVGLVAWNKDDDDDDD